MPLERNNSHKERGGIMSAKAAAEGLIVRGWSPEDEEIIQIEFSLSESETKNIVAEMRRIQKEVI